ncbi:MAG: HDOD domain-containing protein [Anaeromyxobacter sp.]
MLRWLSTLLRPAGHRRPPHTVAVPRLASPPGRRAAAEPAPAPVAEAPLPPDAPPFAGFARALGVEVPPAPDPEHPEEPDPADLVLAEQVLAHFHRNRPGPASAPSLSLKALNLVATPGADVGEMVRLVSADPALSAGILTVANSVFYRGLEEIETVRAAVVRLGLEEAARVVGALSAKSLFNPRLKAELASYAPRFSALYARALTVASGAAWVAMQRRGGRADRAFLGGMLFDVGQTIALRSAAALSAASGQPLDAAQLDRVLDRVHLEVGAECHQEWLLPQFLTVIAVRHHDPEIPGDPEFADLHAVRLCGALLDLRQPARAARAAQELLQSAGALGLSPFAVRSVDAELRQAALRTESAFGLEGGAR